MTALALDCVSVTLGGARIVDRVSAEVGEGEWVALIGPNGAGKTTLLRAVTGFVSYEGSIAVFADDAGTLARKQLARRVALVPQVPLLLGLVSVTVAGNTSGLVVVPSPQSVVQVCLSKTPGSEKFALTEAAFPRAIGDEGPEIADIMAGGTLFTTMLLLVDVVSSELLETLTPTV